MRRRFAVAWRWTRRILLGLLGVAVVAVALGVVLLHTDWGREKVRRQIERAAAKKLAGRVAVGGVDVGLGGSLRLSGLEVYYENGELALSVDELAVDCDLAPLLSGHVDCSTLAVRGVAAYVRPDAGALLAPQPDEKSTLKLDLRSITVSDARVELPGAAIEGIDGIEIAASVKVRGESVGARLDHLTATLRNDGRRLAVSTPEDVSFDGRVLAGDVTIELGKSHLEASLKKLAIETGELSAALSGHIAAADLPIAGWRADLDPDLAIDGSLEAPHLAGTIAAGGGALSLDVGYGERLTARFEAHKIDPAALLEGALPGDVNLAAHLDLAAPLGALETLEGSAGATIHGNLEGEDLGDIEIAATARRGGAISADVTARSPRGSGEVHLEARRGEAGSWTVEQARASGQLAPLAALVPGLSLHSLKLEARAEGPIDALAVAGHVSASGVRYRDLGAAEVRAQIDGVTLSATDFERPSTGGFSLSARELRAGSKRAAGLAVSGRFSRGGRAISARAELRQLDRLERAEVAARIELGEDGSVEARLESLALRAGGLEWRGHGGRVERRGGAIRARGIALASAAGRLGLDARVAPAGDRVELAVHHLDLGRLRPLHGAPLSGTIDGRIGATRRRGRLGATLDLDVDGVVVAARPATRGHIEAALGDGKLTFAAQLSAAGGGEARLALEVAAPPDPLDGRAWLASGEGALRRVEVDLLGVDARQVERFADLGPGAIDGDGRVDVELRLPHDGRRELGFEIDASGGRVAGVKGLAATLRGAWGPSSVSATAELAQGGEPVATIDATLGAGLAELWRRPAALARKALVASARIRNFQLRRLYRAGLVPTPISGFLTARVAAKGPLAAPGIAVERAAVRRLEVGGVTLASLELSGSLDGDRLAASASGRFRTGGHFEAKGTHVLGSARGSVELTAKALPLQALRPLAPEPDHPLADLAGSLDARGVELVLTPEKLRAAGRLTLTGGKVRLESGARQVENIRADIRLRGDQIRLVSLRADTGGGHLDASGRVELAGYVPRSLHLELNATKIPYVAGSYKARIDLAASVAGKLEGQRLVLDIPVERGKVVLKDTGRELQDVGELEDVVFVEQEKAAKAARAKQMARAARVGRAEPRPGAFQTLIRLELRRGVEVEHEKVDARIVGRAEAELADAELVRFSGRLRAAGGTFHFFDRDYDVTRAVATFDGRLPLDPDLDIEVTRTFREATVTAQVHGRLSEVLDDTHHRHVTLSSDGDYTEEQVLALMLGQDPEEQGRSQGQANLGSGIGRAVVAGEVRDLLRSVGVKVDVVRMHDDGWEIGKWFHLDLGVIDRRVLIGYRIRDSGEQRENTSEGTLEVPLGDRLDLEGRIGNLRIGGLDLLWVTRF